MVAFSKLLALVPAVAATPLACKAPPPKQTCQSPNGNLTIVAANLYPESADYDSTRCVTYISNLFANTVSVYDAIKNEVVKVITIDGISGVKEYHVSGVQRDARHDTLSISGNAGAAFDTAGADISGTNFLVQYDLAKGEVAWKNNLTAVTEGRYGGFQDMEHDAAGNTFIIGTFPASILKVSADGQTATPWYVSDNLNSSIPGFSGIAAFDDARSVLVSDSRGGKIVRFDLSAEKGEPVHVPLQEGAEPIGRGLDGAYLPPLYKEEVLLVSDGELGTIVIRANDKKWQSAERVGVIPNALEAAGGSPVATVQIGERVYAVTEFFGDNAPGASLNRTEFPLYDITNDINKLLA